MYRRRKKKSQPIEGFLKLIVAIGIFAGIWLNTRSEKPSPTLIQPSRPAAAPQPETSSTQPPRIVPEGPWPPLSDEMRVLASEPLRKNYYVIFDTSGSMQDTAGGIQKIEAAKEALKFFAGVLPEDANLGMMVFRELSEVVPLGVGNRLHFNTAVQTSQAGGGTPLNASIEKAFERITSQAQLQSGYGEYILVIVTDGKSSDGDPAPLVREIVSRSPIQVKVIGFGIENHTLNISGVTDYTTANSKDELKAALEQATKAEVEDFIPDAFKGTL